MLSILPAADLDRLRFGTKFRQGRVSAWGLFRHTRSFLVSSAGAAGIARDHG